MCARGRIRGPPEKAELVWDWGIWRTDEKVELILTLGQHSPRGCRSWPRPRVGIRVGSELSTGAQRVCGPQVLSLIMGSVCCGCGGSRTGSGFLTLWV